MVSSGLRSFVNNDNLQVLIIITFSSAPEFLVCLIFVMFYASCPLLFLLYINDLPSASNLKCTLYADDSNLLLRGPNIQQTALALNVQLDRVNDYFKANKLKLNTKKTK